MKSLDQIASTGIALTATNAPGDANHHFIISQPGSYYLTGNLAVTRVNGMRVTVPGVTIDLNGFEISRSSGTGGDGINIQPAAHRCVVKNGSVNGFAQGINAISVSARGCLFRNLTVGNCTNYGLRAGLGAVLDSCRVHDCSGTAGIATGDGATLTNCTSQNNSATNAIQTGTGSVLTGCTVSGNTGQNGISAGEGSSLNNCTAAANTLTGSALATADGSPLNNCVVEGNTAPNGINAGDGSSLFNCAAYNNVSTYGILTASGVSLRQCTANSNTSAAATSAGIGTGFGCTITDCRSTSTQSTAATTNGNTGMGFDVGNGSLIYHSVGNGNRGNGIDLVNDSYALGNTCSGNGGTTDSAGMHTSSSDNRIEGNKLSLNAFRNLAVDGSGSIIIKNTSTTLGIPTNYVIAAGNSFGVIVDDVGADDSIFGDSGPGTFGSPNAWANFSH